MGSNPALPFSQASENNKLPILETVKPYLSTVNSVLEIGSGTAQHGEYFAESFPRLIWQCTDIPAHLDITQQRISASSLVNLPPAKPLNVDDSDWNCGRYDCVFSANSLHIMSAASVENFFRGLNQSLKKSAWLILYGPFKYSGEFTTESNARFDVWLKQQNPASGVRDFEWVCELAEANGLSFQIDNPMPANNQLLVFCYA
ncbi:MAG: DUF938 domain-containing protein [Gammaproteobacteria bacterium]|nr:DUF938 domain-containing protein [Gammaproteobacteria bacterium]MDD9895761.1 DUF938 domain-containing protein [Gammaproteobacteria bacterium]